MLKTTVTRLIIIITNAAGISASNERDTDDGTCSGILIITFFFLQNLKISTDKIETIIVTNNP